MTECCTFGWVVRFHHAPLINIGVYMLYDIKQLVEKKKDPKNPDANIVVPIKYLEFLLSIIEDKEMRDLDVLFCDCCLGGVHRPKDKIFFI